ncbi:hypothetical protein [Bacteroides pyogenes]|jgi:hypothetical protein|uniref:DUF3408 domain-containing protein n=1 Tax=Bacteroides pyogenes TaxID=310300 RepID=A0A5D3E9V4_9BACE|nr:hypothetical protein [Bacteroides pyogenes]TYK32814.1 hypothetical protein FNJ60_10410 [Bacteroides pyogenes]
MNKENKSKTSVLALVKAGKAEAEKMQNIKSVIPSISTSEEIVDGITDYESDENLIKNKSNEGLEMLLAKKEIKDSESVKISRDLHRELKILSSMSGVSMMQMISNLIESFLEENKKEISAYRKKYFSSK